MKLATKSKYLNWNYNTQGKATTIYFFSHFPNSKVEQKNVTWKLHSSYFPNENDRMISITVRITVTFRLQFFFLQLSALSQIQERESASHPPSLDLMSSDGRQKFTIYKWSLNIQSWKKCRENPRWIYAYFQIFYFRIQNYMVRSTLPWWLRGKNSEISR